MKLIDLIRLMWKHKVLLFFTPLFLAFLVVLLTSNPNFQYASDTTVFTGIATGSGVEMDKAYNNFTTNAAYDNLINIIKSNKTKKEVGIRLLSQHLMLNKPSPKYISEESYDYFKKVVPASIYSYVVKGNENKIKPTDAQNILDSIDQTTIEIDSFSIYLAANTDVLREVPSYINEDDYEQTVLNLTKLMESSDTNFVYELLHYPNPHYSIKAISEVQVRRISNSDLVQIKFETDDPGICQQTLVILTNVLSRNYREIKENRSDEVVKYFEHQASLASQRLKLAEDKLLEFNKANKIINYYEQSKAVAVVKEDLDVAYHNMRIKLAGTEAAIKRLEDKLAVQGRVQLKSDKIIEMKNKLGNFTYQIALAETAYPHSSVRPENLNHLKSESEKLQNEIKNDITDFYNYGNSVDGLPLDNLLNEWLTNIVEAENLRAGLEVFSNRIDEFQEQYSIYAPAGATVKRIEREISVAEREYLSILYGLNLAKLKVQDNELASIIKITDPPYFPLSPIPTKRKIMVVLAALVGFISVLAFILFAEYFDDSLKNIENAAKVLQMSNLGIIPNANKVSDIETFNTVINRLFGIIIQKMNLFLKEHNTGKPAKVVLFFSTQPQEGKTTIALNTAVRLKKAGKTVLFLNYIEDSLKPENKSLNAENILKQKSPDNKSKSTQKHSIYDLFLNPNQSNLNDNEYLTYNPDEILITSGVNDILAKLTKVSNSAEYILIEIPPIIQQPYPTALISMVDLPVLICRANRVWTHADQAALDLINTELRNKPCYILNGTQIEAIESVLGDLAKKRNWVRSFIKNSSRLQFFTQSKI